jgi:outer membrane protein TolC
MSDIRTRVSVVARPPRAGRTVRLIAIALLLCGGDLGAQQSPAAALTFDEASARLRHVSDALVAAGANVRSKAALNRATRNLRLPDVSLEARQLRFEKSLELGPLQATTADWRFRPIANLALPIYTAGRIPAAQQAAAASLRQAEAERDMVSQTVSVELVQTYFGLQLAVQAAAVRAEALAGLQQHLDHTAALERQGFATKAQRLQAVVSRDQAERERQEAIDDLATAREALANLLHVESPIVPTTGLFVICAPLGSVDEFQRDALARHPQLAQLTAVQDQAAQEVRARQAELKPQAYAFSQYDLYKHDALLTESNWVFGFGLQYVLFTGNGRRDRVTAARDQYDQTGATIRDVRQRLETAVAKAWNDLQTARQTFLLLESSLANAEENVRLQDLSFREGQATSLDVIDARLGLARARIDRSQSAYQFDLALAQLLELSGQAERYPEYIRRADRVIEP